MHGATPQPKRLGRYEIAGTIAVGPRWRIYKGLDPSQRSVLLKAIPRKVLDTYGAAAQFQNDARAAIGLEHTGIVRVYEYGEDADLAFVAMGYRPWRNQAVEPPANQQRSAQNHQLEGAVHSSTQQPPQLAAGTQLCRCKAYPEGRTLVKQTSAFGRWEELLLLFWRNHRDRLRSIRQTKKMTCRDEERVSLRRQDQKARAWQALFHVRHFVDGVGLDCGRKSKKFN